MTTRLLRRRRRSGFTLTDLCIVAALFGVLLCVAGPALVGRSREQANRIKCASNLRTIGQAILMYTNEGRNMGNYPRTFYQKDAPVDVSNKGFDQPMSFAPPGAASPVGTNNVCASFFLPLKTQDIDPEHFICPTSSGQPDKFGDQLKKARSNWSAIPQNLTYSYIVPFQTTVAANAGMRFNTSFLNADFAVAADINPGTTGGGDPADDVLGPAPTAATKEMRVANSNNHNRDGQNVLYGDGHVDFSATPWCGALRVTGHRDNIYTRGATDNNGAGDTVELLGPADQYDSYLLPDDGNQPPAATVLGTFQGNPTLMAVLGVLVLAGIGFGLYFLMRPKKPKAPPPLPPQYGGAPPAGPPIEL